MGQSQPEEVVIHISLLLPGENEEVEKIKGRSSTSEHGNMWLVTAVFTTRLHCLPD